MLKIFKKLNCPFKLTYKNIFAIFLIHFYLISLILYILKLILNRVAKHTGYFNFFFNQTRLNLFKTLKKTQVSVKLLFQTL